MKLPDRHTFWRDAFALRGSITPHVIPEVLTFGILSTGTCSLSWLAERLVGHRLALEAAPYEIAGAALGLLLVFRTNAGYERWWEGRKLWGGIVNQSRNLVIAGLSYGPEDAGWRKRFLAWAAVFPFVCRNSLRGEGAPEEAAALVGESAARELGRSGHMPGLASIRIAQLLKEAVEHRDMDRFAFMKVEEQRASLIDHIGACERILKTPIPRVYAIMVRRFISLFLLTLPLALLHRLESDWLIPLITMMVAYPLLGLDQISIELQNPFTHLNLNHLPLDDIARTIDRNIGEYATAAGDPESAVVSVAEWRTTA
jgi:putative membrane protein